MGDTAAQFVKALVDANKSFKLYTIDNFQHDNVSGEQKDIDQAHSGYNDYLKNIAELEVDQYINTIVSDSIEAASQFEDKTVYFLYVDDCHGYGHVKKEIEEWLPKIAAGGIIFGDDYNSDDVKRAFDEAFGNKLVSTGTGGCYVFL